ncbi:hypothetical protein [Phenylobacterium sp.]|uniref:hypothetical protein n=1 Tax=Phenylobacterium sp. TaxID=1871053 RepID=UPI002DECF5F3|nr:hypothetical protein [Phenylobacterium sp.]
MSRPTSAPIAALLAAVALSGGLAGCAQMGLGGHGAGAGNQPRQAQDPNHPTATIDPRDQSASPAPPRTLPIPGSGQNPTASGPQGALADPYSNPPR